MARPNALTLTIDTRVMNTLTFHISDSRDRNVLLALLRRFGIEVAEDVQQPDTEAGSATFYRNAKKHIAKQRPGVSPGLSLDIDKELYGG